MKKRITAFALVLIMMLGMVPTASAAKIMGIINSDFTGRTAYSIACNYYSATKENFDKYAPEQYLDPHEAWNAYITTQKPNNWFNGWLEDNGRGNLAAGDITGGCGKPNNLTYNEDWAQEIISIWWAGVDSYIADVQDKHQTKTKGQPTQLTEEEEQWVLWWSAKEYTTEAHGEQLLISPYAEYTFQEWKDFLNGMSDKEHELFIKWWQSAVYTAQHGIGNYERVYVSYEEWKTNKGYGNKPIEVHTVVEPVEPVETPVTDEPDGMAYASTQTVDLDGKPVTFQCYALKDENGNLTNYVKLRDLALYLNGTSRQFEVEYRGYVCITQNQPYTQNGSELTTPFTGDRPYSVNECVTAITKRGNHLLDSIILTDDNGGGYTYYQLRDLGKNLGFNVGWSADKGMFIETDKGYDPNN